MPWIVHIYIIKEIFMNRNRKIKISKFLATGVMAGAVMLSAVPVQTFAASDAAKVGVQGEQTDSGASQTVTVGGLKSGSIVKLYQIVDGYYKDGKLVRYVLMDPVNANIAAIGDDEKGQTDGTNDIITEAEITTIANNIQSGAFTAGWFTTRRWLRSISRTLIVMKENPDRSI